ncbi:MAG TPA: hypothetical protein VL460_03970 [Caulobacteraceae bacterium]|jgi:hypothetical protein|nr:hypothetical protein [Caulobacteraceae bacterium]
MDPQLSDDKTVDAERHPVAHEAQVAADSATKAASGLAGLVLLGLFVVFVVLSLLGVFLFRPGQS